MDEAWEVQRKQSGNKRKGREEEACQPMFSESVYPPSRRPVTSCRNNLIAVCRAHTNQSIGMWTLSVQAKFAEESRRSFHSARSVLKRHSRPDTLSLSGRSSSFCDVFVIMAAWRFMLRFIIQSDTAGFRAPGWNVMKRPVFASKKAASFGRVCFAVSPNQNAESRGESNIFQAGAALGSPGRVSNRAC